MIHQYKLNGYNIVLDVYSGSIHYMDNLVYDIITIHEKNSREHIIQQMLEKYSHCPNIDVQEINDALDDIQTLIDHGQLFSKDTFADKAFTLKKKQNSLKAICLHIAHTCNLNCEYCFASQGKYHGERALMSFEIGKQALDFLVANSGNHLNLEVDFFGGEPLMNWGVVKQLVHYARSIEKEAKKNFRFTLTTNGILIDDDVIEFSNQEMYNVVLSLDGRKKVHDRLRQTMSGQGSYELIVPKFQDFVSKRQGREYYIRGTFTHNNPDFTNDIIHMLDLGFRELSMEPVVCAADDPYALTDDDLPILFKQYELLAKEQIKRAKARDPFNFYHYMIDLTHGPCIYKRISGCGTGTEYLAVTPIGELYPCHQFVGEESFILGDVWQGITNDALQEQFCICNVYAKKECENCWAKLFCSGGCPANAYHATGLITGIYDYGCDLFRKRIECAIMIQIALQND